MTFLKVKVVILALLIMDQKMTKRIERWDEAHTPMEVTIEIAPVHTRISRQVKS